MIGWCPWQQGAFLTWLKQATWLTMQSKMVRLIQEKIGLNQKGATFRRKKRVKPNPYTNRTNLTNPKGIPRTRTTQTTNHITRLWVIKHIQWFLIIPLPITKHKLYKHAYPSQTISQALQGLTTLRITNTIIFDPKNGRSPMEPIPISFTKWLPQLI